MSNEIPLVVSRQMKMAYVLAAILYPLYVVVALLAIYTIATKVTDFKTLLLLLLFSAFVLWPYYHIAGIIHTIKIYKDRIEKTFPLIPFVKLTYRFSDYDKAVIKPVHPAIFTLVLCKAKKEKKVIGNILAYENTEEMVAAIPILGQ